MATVSTQGIMGHVWDIWDMASISVSKEDVPKFGGMIARNPENRADQWYVAETYFEKVWCWCSQDQKTCKETLEIADDFGDNHATMHCQLPKNHRLLPHQETYTSDSGYRVTVQWEKTKKEQP